MTQMPVSVGALLQDIRPYVNIISAPRTAPIEMLESMWLIGEVLQARGLNKPHSIGFALQEASGGLVKRALVFRSAKVRTIWPNIEELRSECAELRSVINVVEMLPYLDPKEQERYGISPAIIRELRREMVRLTNKEFEPRLRNFKRTHPSKNLGQPLDRSRRLPEMSRVANVLLDAHASLDHLVSSGGELLDPGGSQGLVEELRAAAGASDSKAKAAAAPTNVILAGIGNALKESGAVTSDTKRRRLWRLCPRERLMELAELVRASCDPNARTEFLSHRTLAEKLLPSAASKTT